MPFDATTLASLYPTHKTYMSAINKASNSAKKAGFLLAADTKLIKAAAKASDVGS